MRLNKLKRTLKKEGKYPYFVSDLNNIKYITGFTGSFACLGGCKYQEAKSTQSIKIGGVAEKVNI